MGHFLLLKLVLLFYLVTFYILFLSEDTFLVIKDLKNFKQKYKEYSKK